MTHLKPGDKAPDFSGVDDNGKPLSLRDFKGRKLVLYFYPKDATPGCTAEACSLRDDYETLREHGFDVVGVSADSVKSHKKFVDNQKLPFRLLADEDTQTIRAYGVWGKKKFMGREYEGIARETFVINEEGVIDKVFEKVETKNHAGQILKAYNLS